LGVVDLAGGMGSPDGFQVMIEHRFSLSENPLERSALAKRRHCPTKGLRRFEFSGKMILRQIHLSPALPDMPARPQGGSSCFWVVVSPNQITTESAFR
jgi:hypothetical protein